MNSLQFYDNMRAWAVALAELDYRVFRLPPNCKSPPMAGWQKRASSDPAKVYSEWTDPFGESTDDNIGILCGDGLFVLDVDVRDRRRGEESLQALVDLGLDTNTLTVITPSGGKHLYYQTPPGLELRGLIGELGEGLDARAQGNYVVGVGSVTPEGEYEWYEGGAPTLPIPEMLIARLQRKSPRSDAPNPRLPLVNPDDPDHEMIRVRYIEHESPEADEGHRNSTAYKVSCALGDRGASNDGAYDHIRLWNDTKCYPPLDDEELIRTCDSAFSGRENPIGNALAAAEFDVVEVEDRPGKGAAAPWSDPVDLWADQPDPPPLPPGAVPDLIWQFATDRALRLGVEPGAPAAALITALSSLVPAGSVIQPRQRDTQWTVKAISWTMIIGPPGSNKSAVLAQAMMPVREIEREWRQEFQREKSRYQAAQEFSPTTKTPHKKPAGRAMDEAAAAPDCRRKIANDATIEALASLLAKNHDGILFFADELAGLFGGMDAYRQRSGKDRPFWLQAKDGGPLTIDRRTQDSIHVPNCAVSVLGSIQSDKIVSLAPGLTDDGLMQRFTPIFIRRSGNGEDQEPNTALDELILETARGIVAGPSTRFRLAPDADAELQAVIKFKDDEIACALTDSAFCQWLDKLPNEFARVALAFHYIEWNSSEGAHLIGGGVPPPNLISAETARRARRFLTEFVYGHARVLYGQLPGEAVADKHAQWVAGFILARKLDAIDERDVYRSYPSLRSQDKRGDIQAVMRRLELLDWVRPVKFRTNTNQAQGWAVNPSVHDGRFATRAESERCRRERVREKIGAAAAAR